MEDIIIEKLQRIRGNYKTLGLDHNPFSTEPLFVEITSDREFREDRPLFHNREDEALKALSPLNSPQSPRRILVYGDIGVGKSSFLNYILSASRKLFEIKGKKERSYLPIRVIVEKEEPLRIVQDMVRSYSLELIKLIKEEKGLSDRFMGFIGKGKEKEVAKTLLRATGKLSESKTKELGLKGIKFGESTDILFERLSISEALDFLKSLSYLTTELGYKGAVIGIDEADKLADKVAIALLRSGRVIFYVKNCFFYFVGSETLKQEIDKNKDVSGLFDLPIIQLSSFDFKTSEKIVETRLKKASFPADKSLYDIFDKTIFTSIYNLSEGIVKELFKICEQLVEFAVSLNKSRIDSQVYDLFLEEYYKIMISELKQTELDIIRKISDWTSPSDRKFQAKTGLKRSTLTKLMNRLLEKGILDKEKRRRKIYYKPKPIISNVLRKCS